jgi:hypothetical protein
MVLPVIGCQVVAATGVPKVDSSARPVALRLPYRSVMLGKAILTDLLDEKGMVEFNARRSRCLKSRIRAI